MFGPYAPYEVSFMPQPINKICPFCNCNVSQKKYKLHITDKCPKRKDKKRLTEYKNWSVCKSCEKKVEQQLLQNHLKEVHWNNDYKCKECGEVLKLSEFIVHIRKYCQSLIIEECHKCNIRLKKTLMRNHLLRCLQQNAEGLSSQTKTVYGCTHCGRATVLGSNYCYTCGYD